MLQVGCEESFWKSGLGCRAPCGQRAALGIKLPFLFLGSVLFLCLEPVSSGPLVRGGPTGRETPRPWKEALPCVCGAKWVSGEETVSVAPLVLGGQSETWREKAVLPEAASLM